MAKKFIIGSWASGAINENSTLPTVNDDNSIWQVQGVDNSEISVSKNDLPNPAEWKEYLKVGRRLVLAVDDSKPWDAHGEAILGGGYIIRQQARVNDTIRIKIVGPDQYLTQRIATSIYNGNITDPNTKALDLTGDTYQSLMAQTIKHCFTPTGSGTRPTPPTIPITYPNTNAGSLKFECLNSDMLTYQQILDELFDASPYGNEWRWQWRWNDATKTGVNLFLTIGGDTSAEASQINSNVNLNISLDTENFKISGFEQGDEMDGTATRLIAQTKTGDAETSTGSDFTIRTNPVNDVLYDTSFNPGVELTPEQLEAQIASRLAALANLSGTTMLEVAEPLELWLPRLGQILNIDGGTNNFTSGYSTTVRLVKISGTIGTISTKLEIVPLQARYPKLPPKSPFTPSKNSGAGNGGPVAPRLPANAPKPPSGGGGPVIPTMPTFEPPVFQSATPYLVLETTGSWAGDNYNMFQEGGVIYKQTESAKEANTGTSSRTFSSLEDLNTQTNALLNTTNTMVFSKMNFTNSTTQTTTTLPISFDIKGTIGWNSIIPDFDTYVIAGYIYTYMNSVFWVKGDEIFLWVYGYKNITSAAYNNTNVLGGVLASNFGSKIFKNTLTGTSSSWVDTGWVPKVGGQIIFPFGQETVLVQNNEVVLCGYGYLDDPSTDGTNLSGTAGISYYLIDYNFDKTVGRYATGIPAINLTTGAVKTYPAPNWISSTAAQTDVTLADREMVSMPKPMRWVKSEGSNDSRIGIVLMNLGQDQPFYRSWENIAFQMAFAYWNKTAATIEAAYLDIPPQQNNSQSFAITNGMFIITARKTGGYNDFYSRRTKNSSGEWIESPQAGGWFTGHYTQTAAAMGKHGSYVLGGNWQNAGLGFNNIAGRNGFFFTYGNYWFSSIQTDISRGHFNN